MTAPERATPDPSPAATRSPGLAAAAAAIAALAAALTAASCSWNVKGDNFKLKVSEPAGGEWHRDILATVFWVGEPGNEQSAWDPRWQTRFGGVDHPDRRSGWLPAGFTPGLNVFYCALPYNDVAGQPDRRSAMKGRWVEVRSRDRSCFCQWEDVGPWRTDDHGYVLGSSRPAAEASGRAGIDVSPAVRDYLGLTGRDRVDWRFVPAPPAGPWNSGTSCATAERARGERG